MTVDYWYVTSLAYCNGLGALNWIVKYNDNRIGGSTFTLLKLDTGGLIGMKSGYTGYHGINNNGVSYFSQDPTTYFRVDTL